MCAVGCSHSAAWASQGCAGDFSPRAISRAVNPSLPSASVTGLFRVAGGDGWRWGGPELVSSAWTCGLGTLARLLSACLQSGVPAVQEALDFSLWPSGSPTCSGVISRDAPGDCVGFCGLGTGPKSLALVTSGLGPAPFLCQPGQKVQTKQADPQKCCILEGWCGAWGSPWQPALSTVR